MKVSARRVQVQQLFPAIQGMQASIGEVNGDAFALCLRSAILVASLLGASNGEIKASMRQGTVSKLLLEEMGLNVGSVVVTKLIGDKQVKLECLAADFGVRDGLMQTRSFIVDTDAALINVDGTIDLKQEQMDFTVRPKSKGLRYFLAKAAESMCGQLSTGASTSIKADGNESCGGSRLDLADAAGGDDSINHYRARGRQRLRRQSAAAQSNLRLRPQARFIGKKSSQRSNEAGKDRCLFRQSIYACAACLGFAIAFTRRVVGRTKCGDAYPTLRQYSGNAYARRRKSTSARMRSGKWRRCANTA